MGNSLRRGETSFEGVIERDVINIYRERK